MPKVHFVKKARTAIPNAGIEPGDSYYWWRVGRRGEKKFSKEYPRRANMNKPIGWMLACHDGIPHMFELFHATDKTFVHRDFDNPDRRRRRYYEAGTIYLQFFDREVAYSAGQLYAAVWQSESVDVNAKHEAYLEAVDRRRQCALAALQKTGALRRPDTEKPR